MMDFNLLNTLACSVCFGDPSHPQTKGLLVAIIALLGFLSIIMVSLIIFFFNLNKRGKMNPV